MPAAAVILAGTMSFVLGQFITRQLNVKNIVFLQFKGERTEKQKMIPVILGIQALMFVFYLGFIVQTGGGPGPGMIARARNWQLANGIPNIIGHMNLLAFSIAAVYTFFLARNLILEKRKRNMISEAVIILLYLLMEAVSSSRSGLINYLACCMCISVYFFQKRMTEQNKGQAQQRKKMITVLTGTAVFVAAVFVTAGNLTGKTGQLGAVNMISTYFGGSVYNLDWLLDRGAFPESSFKGEMTLPVISSVLRNVFGCTGRGAIEDVLPMNLIPSENGAFSPTNLYTSLTYPAMDYGPAGMTVFFLMLGMMYGIVYNYVRKAETPQLSLIIYGVIMIPLTGASASYMFGIQLFSPYAVYRLVYLIAVFRMCTKLKTGHRGLSV